jgi:hypothetical protein
MLLLVAMPSMDDVDIALVQRGDQSRGVRIPGTVIVIPRVTETLIKVINK